MCRFGKSLGGLVFGGFVPGRSTLPFSPWSIVPKSVIRKILCYAGADISSLSNEKVGILLDGFLSDTNYSLSHSGDIKEKISTPSRVILADGDIFTKAYREPEKNFKKYIEQLLSVEVFKGNDHYFQTDKADIIISAISSALER